MTDIIKAALGLPILAMITLILVLCAWTVSAAIVARDLVKLTTGRFNPGPSHNNGD